MECYIFNILRSQFTNNNKCRLYSVKSTSYAINLLTCVWFFVPACSIEGCSDCRDRGFICDECEADLTQTADDTGCGSKNRFLSFLVCLWDSF